MDDFDLDDIDYNYEALSELSKDELIDLIQKQREKIVDEREGIIRDERGEEVVTDDKAVDDEEETIS